MSLRERIARREGCDVERVVVGPGSKHLRFSLFSVLGARDAEAAFPTPHWPAYELAARQLQMMPVLVPSSLENGWTFDARSMDTARLVVLCNPLNPTSTVYPPALVQEVLERARARGAHVILDEAYKGLAFQEIPRYDAIRVRSFSKEFCIEGWRLGYAVAPREVVQRICANREKSVLGQAIAQMTALF